MKVFRNTICFVLLMFCLFSCDENDDKVEEKKQEEVNPIIGKYSQIKKTNSTVALDECELKETIELKADGTVIEEDYDPNFVNETSSEFDGCKLSKTLTYKWEKTGEEYYFTQDGERYKVLLELEGEELSIKAFQEPSGSFERDQVFKRIK